MELFFPCTECTYAKKREANGLSGRDLDCLMCCLMAIVEGLRAEMKAEKDWLPVFPEGKIDYTDGFRFTGKGQVKE